MKLRSTAIALGIGAANPPELLKEHCE